LEIKYGISKTLKEEIKSVLDTLKVPYVHFVQPAPMALAACGRTSGIVVYSGAKMTWVTHVKNGEVKSSYPLAFGGDDAGNVIVSTIAKSNFYYARRLKYYDEHQKLSCITIKDINKVPTPQISEGKDKDKEKDKQWKHTVPEQAVTTISKFAFEKITEITANMPEEEKDLLWKSVVLCGGNTAFLNFTIRFDEEMKSLYPNFAGVLKYLSDDLAYTTYQDIIPEQYVGTVRANSTDAMKAINLLVTGASHYASLQGFRDKCEKLFNHFELQPY